MTTPHPSDPGSWLGAAVIACAIALLVALVLAGVLEGRRGLFAGVERWLVGAALASVLLVDRPVTGWWLRSMWAAGRVQRDREDPEGGRR